MEIKRITPPTVFNLSAVQQYGMADSDRDSPQGQTQGDPEPELNRPLTEEELRDVLQHLSQFPGFQEAGLTHQLEKNADGSHVVLIYNADKLLVRRLPEKQLWAAFVLHKSKDKGGLINEAA